MGRGGKFPQWTADENKVIRRYYGKIKIDELEEKLPNRTRGAIQKWAQRIGLKGNPALASKKYKFNEKFFDVPNIKNCYWAGFIAADGCLTKDGGIRIALAAKDECIIDHYMKHVGFNGPKYHYRVNGRKYVALTIWGAYRWHEMLKKHWSVTPRKSLTLKRPKVSHDRALAFIVGLIDGDGHMCWTQSGNKQIFNLGLAGTRDICLWVRNHIHNLVPPWNKEISVTLANGHPRIVFRGVRALMIAQSLNKRTSISWKLKRKWNKAKNTAG